VKIDLHHQLYAWRQHVTEARLDKPFKRWVLRRFARTIARPRLYRPSTAILRFVLRYFPHTLTTPHWMAWTRYRDWPEIPKMTFRDWMIAEREKGGNEKSGKT
jgi:L-lactate dehydrogenase complex protein LldF